MEEGGAPEDPYYLWAWLVNKILRRKTHLLRWTGWIRFSRDAPVFSRALKTSLYESSPWVLSRRVRLTRSAKWKSYYVIWPSRVNGNLEGRMHKIHSSSRLLCGFQKHYILAHKKTRHRLTIAVASLDTLNSNLYKLFGLIVLPPTNFHCTP